MSDIKPNSPDLRKSVISCARKVAREMPLTAAIMVWGGGTPWDFCDRDVDAVSRHGTTDLAMAPSRAYGALYKLASFYGESHTTLENLASLRGSKPDQQPSWMLALATDVMEKALRNAK
jgi:hypothetical protein